MMRICVDAHSAGEAIAKLRSYLAKPEMVSLFRADITEQGVGDKTRYWFTTEPKTEDSDEC